MMLHRETPYWLLLLVALASCSIHDYHAPADGRNERAEAKCTSRRRPAVGPGVSLDVRMPSVRPSKADNYLCTGVHIPSPEATYIVNFTPRASMEKVHHMILFGCKLPGSQMRYWDCGTKPGACHGPPNIMYAWARNATATHLPEGVAFQVSGESGINYLVLEAHYGNIAAFKGSELDCSGVTVSMISKSPQYLAGILLMVANSGIIPAGKKETNIDISCEYNIPTPIHPFAFRVHSHYLSNVISGYRVRKGKWDLIGRQNPLLPQAFYPRNETMSIEKGDTLAARCVYNSEGMKTDTIMGPTSSDEMCNFYMMYYTESRNGINFLDCYQPGDETLFRMIPAEANIPVPIDPALLHEHAHHHAAMPEESASHRHFDTMSQPSDDAKEDNGIKLQQVKWWRPQVENFGQVSAVAMDSDGLVYFLHRGDKEWGSERLFGEDQVFLHREPITTNPIIALEANTGQEIWSGGKNRFYLPHGLTIDQKDNIWVTDIALHQVFNLGSRKDWSRHDGQGSLIVLGKAFDPGSDLLHFCKPTAVAVDAFYEEVFVADGYCNSRIIAFSLPDGKYLRHWGRAGFGLGQFNIPHDLTWAPNLSQHAHTDNLPALCVSDRENGRLQCFAPKSGNLLREIRPKGVTTVFSAAYTPEQGGLLYVLDARYSPMGLVLNYSTGRTISKFFAESPPFSMPHNLAILGNNSAVFVADVNAHALFKFVPKDQALRSTAKWKGSAVGLVVSPVAIIALLSAPVLILLAVGGYAAWRHRHYMDFSGRKGAGLNLGSFLARRSTHSHKGFDILSTEESDREHEDEDEDDEVVEYSASSSLTTRER